MNYSLPEKVVKLLSDAKKQGKKIVLATGVFDILHLEHLNFLKKAKKIGDVLLVGLETDQRVKQLKGAGRPINSQQLRLSNLKSFGVADAIFLLPSGFSELKQHQQLIELIKPDFLAVSSHTVYLENKQKVMDKVGGKLVVVHQHNPLISSTTIIRKMKGQN